MNGMLNPDILKDAVTIGAFYIEGGVRSFAEFSAKMVEEFGEGVRKYLRPAYDELRKRTDIDTTGMDPEEGGETAPKAPPAEPPPPVQPPPPEEREALRLLDNEMNRLGVPRTTNPQNIKNRLKDLDKQIEDLNKQLARPVSTGR